MEGRFGSALDNRSMVARVVTFIVWGLVAASAVFWGLRAGGAGPSAPPHATAAPAFTPPPADWARVLGEGPPAAAGTADGSSAAITARSDLDASRLTLLGVVAATSGNAQATASRQPFALIALDGKPARTYRTGAAVEGEMVVQAIEPRRVQLGPRGGQPTLTLELPAGAVLGSTSAAERGDAPGPTRTGRTFGNTPARPAASASPAAAPPRASGATEDADAEPSEPARPPRRTEPAILRAPSPLNR